MNAALHFCDLSEIDYARVDDGYLVCNVCHRQWTLKIWNDRGYWNAYPPMQPMPPRNLWPMDSPEVIEARRVEIANTRQARLTMLDRLERNRAEALSESLGAANRFSSMIGKKPKVESEPVTDFSVHVFTKTSIFNSMVARAKRVAYDQRTR